MTSILLISPTQGLSARVPEVIADPRISVVVAGTSYGHLMDSRFVDSYEVIAARPIDFVTALVADPGILRRDVDWILFDDDLLMRALTQSTLPDDVKERVLPAGSTLGRAMLGSKIGQQVAAEAAGVPMPRAIVAHTMDEVIEAVDDVDGPVMVKGDVGGGGAAVWLVRDSRDLPARNAITRVLPVLVQEYVAGPLVNIEPLFDRGRLLGYIQSETLECTRRGKGPTTARRFSDPRAPDLQQTLESIGAVGRLHGFGNLTFLWCRRRQRHLLIECDMRINTWVQFGPAMGMDWRDLLISRRPANPIVPSLGARGHIVRLYPREVEAGLTELRWSLLRPWLQRGEGTWESRNNRDEAVNTVERRSILSRQSLARCLLLVPLQRVWNRLPTGTRERMEQRGWKAHALRSFGIPT
ncbi:MAG: hypothetical protein WEA35_08875 [Candidatus Nanopelagicales bacterium]